jgi:hypothetical protein
VLLNRVTPTAAVCAFRAARRATPTSFFQRAVEDLRNRPCSTTTAIRSCVQKQPSEGHFERRNPGTTSHGRGTPLLRSASVLLEETIRAEPHVVRRFGDNGALIVPVQAVRLSCTLKREVDKSRALLAMRPRQGRPSASESGKPNGVLHFNTRPRTPNSRQHQSALPHARVSTRQTSGCVRSPGLGDGLPETSGTAHCSMRSAIYLCWTRLFLGRTFVGVRRGGRATDDALIARRRSTATARSTSVHSTTGFPKGAAQPATSSATCFLSAELPLHRSRPSVQFLLPLSHGARELIAHAPPR